MQRDLKDVSRLNPNGRREGGNGREDGSVHLWNDPTQANIGLEWGTGLGSV